MLPTHVAHAVLIRTAAAAAECAEWARPRAPTVCSKAADGAGAEQQWWLAFEVDCISGALAGSQTAVSATASEAAADAAMLPRVTEFSYERGEQAPAGRRSC